MCNANYGMTLEIPKLVLIMIKEKPLRWRSDSIDYRYIYFWANMCALNKLKSENLRQFMTYVLPIISGWSLDSYRKPQVHSILKPRT